MTEVHHLITYGTEKCVAEKSSCNTLSPVSIFGGCAVLMDQPDFLILILTSLWCCDAEFGRRRESQPCCANATHPEMEMRSLD